MTSWREEYLIALGDRDEREKARYAQVSDGFIEAYTSLLDRTAALEAARNAKTDISSKDTGLPPALDDCNAQLRSDLAESIRSHGQLKARVKVVESELVQLRAKSKADTIHIDEMKSERTELIRKVKDRGDELREKAKFLDDAQDEIVSLDIQLNMSEKTVERLKKENKDLIDRWMARKGREADEMNETLG